MTTKSRNLLRGRMAERGMTGKKLAKALGITELTFSRKLNGLSGTGFTVREATLICEALNIRELDARARIFLND